MLFKVADEVLSGLFSQINTPERSLTELDQDKERFLQL
jgi:hypothetical protein